MLLVKENPLLAEVEALQKCYRVLDLICEKCMKQKDMNEVLAMKMHYISCIFQKCITFLKEREDKLDGFIKRCVFLQRGLKAHVCTSIIDTRKKTTAGIDRIGLDNNMTNKLLSNATCIYFRVAPTPCFLCLKWHCPSLGTKETFLEFQLSAGTG